MKYLFILVFLLSSCITPKSLESDEKVFIHVDGHPIELVSDEYENQYIKQKTACGIVYIPFTFPTEDENVPRIYEIKTQKNGTTK